eukprot:1186636-Amorphochlora_amoeboformis.AAC.1
MNELGYLTETLFFVLAFSCLHYDKSSSQFSSREFRKFLEKTTYLLEVSLSVTWRDITLCQGIPGCLVLPGTTGYYQVLPGTIWYNPQ